MGSHSVCSDWMYRYCVLYLAWWWFNEPKHVAEFLILITNVFCVVDWINYYVIAKQNGMTPIRVITSQAQSINLYKNTGTKRLNEPKQVAEFLILITNICCVYWLNKLLCYCKTQLDDSYQSYSSQAQSINLYKNTGTKWLNEPKQVAEFLILITNILCLLTE